MFDITSMLGNSGSGSNNSVGTFDFANYAAIKNGSYGKLVKAYYADSAKSAKESNDLASSAKSTSASKAKAAQDVDKTGLTTLKKNANELKSSAEALGKDELWKGKDGKVDMTAVAGAVKSFANDYNKVIDQSSKVNSKEVAQDVKFMTGMTDTFKKVLGRIGVTVGDDGKMSVDEEALKKADIATVRSLFEGNATYGEQIADKANSIAKDTEMSTGVYGNDATVSSALSSLYNQFV